MVAHLVDSRLPSNVREVLCTYYLRVQNFAGADRLWSRLSPQQRATLGNDFDAAGKNGCVVGMWQRLYEVGTERAIVDAAKHLNLIDDATREWLLREIGELSPDPDDLESIFPLADLIIIENPRKAYWRGQEIPVDWAQHGKPWEYLVILATFSKAGQPVDSSAFHELAASDYHIKMKSRLSGLEGFPLDLALRIERPCAGLQILAIPPERIRILCRQTQEVLVSSN